MVETATVSTPELKPVSPPYLISWNLTKRCNLKCGHCYLDSTELDGKTDISTEKAYEIIDSIASLSPGAMLILTGGEPLLRPDIFNLAARAADSGLTPVLGTNGTLIDSVMAEQIKASKIKGVGLSLDSATPLFHDSFRALDGAWAKTLKAAELLHARSMDFQLQFTVMRENMQELQAVIELAIATKARAVNIFFLVCTGRGSDRTDLTPEQYEEALNLVAKAEIKYRGRLMVRARCAPHILRITEEMGNKTSLAGATAGCIAADGYLRIAPDGGLTPCPYIPVTEATPNIFSKSNMPERLSDIWKNGKDFQLLRSGAAGGKCSGCDYEVECGGCRARALATSGDLLGEDPLCAYDSSVKTGKNSVKEENENGETVWTDEATERLNAVPPFLKVMVKAGVERYARHLGQKIVTPELMQELKGKTGM